MFQALIIIGAVVGLCIIFPPLILVVIIVMVAQ